MSKSNKKILLSNKKQLEEMPMQFDNRQDVRPHPTIQQNLANNNTPLKKIPFPKPDRGSVATNFQELLASERYREVLDKVKTYTGYQTIRNRDVALLMQQMMQAANYVMQTERRYKTQLEQLALELVMREMGINEGDIEYDGKIVGLQDIDAEFNRNSQGTDNVRPDIDNDEMDADGDQSPEDHDGKDTDNDGKDAEDNPDVQNVDDEDAKIESQLYNRLKDLNMERAKRRFINAMVQGASKRGHYMYHLVEERLRQITGSDQLLNSYGVMMSVNDLLYWMLPDNYVDAMGLGERGMEAGQREVTGVDDETNPNYEPDMGNLHPGEPHIGDMMPSAASLEDNPAGSQETDRSGDVPKVKARGFCFPVLIHELIKGTMEVISYHGLPEDHEMAQQVIDLEDVLTKEFWDFRLGPAIWARMRNQMPEDILSDDDKKELQNFIFMEFFSLPAKEFLVFAREVVSGSQKGARLMKELCDEAAERMQNKDDEDYDYGLSNFRRDLNSMSKELDDDDIDNLLKGLNIMRSDDDDDDDK
jgi:ribosomal protein L20